MKEEFQKENQSIFLLNYFDEILKKGFYSRYLLLIQKILKLKSISKYLTFRYFIISSNSFIKFIIRIFETFKKDCI